MAEPTKKPNNSNSYGNNQGRPSMRGGRPGGRPGRTGADRPKPEFDHKVIDVRRVARVVAGGRRFSFSVVLIAGNKKGKVGVGLGKAGDTSLAIAKAMNQAIKNMITIPLTKANSIAHEVEAKFGSSRLTIKPAPKRGMIAGSAVRLLLELGGVHDVNAKILSKSKNKLNLARATIMALSKLAKHK